MFPQIPIFGFISISMFWLFSLLGILIAVHLLLKSIQRQRLNIDVFTKHIVLMAISGIFFSRAVRGIFVWKDYADRGKSIFELFYLFDNEYSVWGAIIGALLVFLPFAYKKKQDILKWLDTFTIPFLAGFSIGNIGIFLDGARHFGTPTDLPWGVIIENSKFALPIHPVAIYTAIYSIAIAYGIHLLCRKKLSSFWNQSGNIFLLATSTFSLIRFLEEFIIGSDKYLNLFGIYITYYIALTTFAAATTILVLRYREYKEA